MVPDYVEHEMPSINSYVFHTQEEKYQRNEVKETKTRSEDYIFWPKF